MLQSAIKHLDYISYGFMQEVWYSHVHKCGSCVSTHTMWISKGSLNRSVAVSMSASLQLLLFWEEFCSPTELSLAETLPEQLIDAEKFEQWSCLEGHVIEERGVNTQRVNGDKCMKFKAAIKNEKSLIERLLGEKRSTWCTSFHNFIQSLTQ